MTDDLGRRAGPDRPPDPQPGRLQPHRPPAGSAPSAAQPAHRHHRDGVPGLLLPDLRPERQLRQPAGRAWQCLGLHHDQHGVVRGRPGDHERRGTGLDRAGRGLEPPAAADAAVGTRLHPHQGTDRAVLGLASVVVVYAVGALTGKPSMPAYLWIVTGLCVWIGSLVFAAFGLFMGYLLPTENVMQLLSFALVHLRVRRRPVHPAEPVPARAADAGHLHAAVRPQRAHARTAARRQHQYLVGRQRTGLAGHLRGRRDLAIPQGHRAGLSPARPAGVVTAARPGPASIDAGRDGGLEAAQHLLVARPLELRAR